MQANEQSKLIELIKKAVSINEELLKREKKFIEDVSSNTDSTSLATANEELNELCLKEHLTLAAAKSLLQIVNKNDSKEVDRL